MRRYYALLLVNDGKARLVKALDGDVDPAEVVYYWQQEHPYRLRVEGNDSTTTLEISHLLQSGGVRTLVVPRDAKGSLIVHPDGSSEEVSGISVKIVDTTGARDAFNATLPNLADLKRYL